MNSEFMREAERLFRHALEMPHGARDAWLLEHASSDELRQAVLRLLAADAETAREDLLSPSPMNAGQFVNHGRAQDAPAAGATQPAITMDARDVNASGAAAGSFAERLPERVGPYRVPDQIGRRGGMGSVYRAVREDGAFHYHVALKVIKRGVDSEEVIHRFALEQQILSALNHPNVARLYDGGALPDGRPYFAMEWVDGLSIDDYCDKNKLSTHARLRLFLQVCAAVHHAHENTVIHRDIKPSNILVNTKGEPKLVDFGIAKLLNPALGAAGHATQIGQVVGTYAYMSPEQVRGDPLTTRTDVYSLGVLLYELLTGHHPYRVASTSRQEIERVICDVDPARPSTAISQTRVIERDGRKTTLTPELIAKCRDVDLAGLQFSLRGEVESILLMALRKVPARRYASAAALADDIERLLDGRPVTAQPDSLGYRLRTFVRRNRALTSGAAAVLLTLVAGILATSWQWRRAVRSETVAVLERKSADEARSAADATAARLAEMLDTLRAQFRGELRRTEGATAARKALASTYLAAVEEIGTTTDQPRVKAQLVEAWLMAAEICDGRRGAVLGERARATEYLRRVEAALPGLPVESRAEFEERWRWQLADLEIKYGGCEKAAADLQAYEALLRNRLRDEPGDAGLRRKLATALFEIGECGLSRALPHELSAARARFEEALGICKELRADAPGERERERDVAAACVALARLEHVAGNHEKRRDFHREALGIREALYAVAGKSGTARRDCLLSLIDVGEAELDLFEIAAVRGDTIPQAARDCWQKAGGLFAEISRAEPDDARIREDELPFRLFNARMFLLDHTLGDAEKELETLIQQAARILDATPGHRNARHYQDAARSMLAGLRRDRSDHPG